MIVPIIINSKPNTCPECGAEQPEEPMPRVLVVVFFVVLAVLAVMFVPVAYILVTEAVPDLWADAFWPEENQ